MQMGGYEYNGQSKPDELKEIFRSLVESSLYRAFASDFSRSTGLPLSFTPVESWQLAHHDRLYESPFCALLARHGSACAVCLRTQHKVAIAAPESGGTVECIHGLYDTAVPVRAGEYLLGFIRTGQVFRREPTAAGFKRVMKRLAKLGVSPDAAALRAAFSATQTVPLGRYRSMVGLLHLLAQHLSLLSNRLLLHRAHAEPPVITSARAYIETHYGEPLSLQTMADAVRTNRFRLSKFFRKATGIRFTNYVTRLRVEKAENLFLNPHYSISEVAFGAGFQSLVHFNRSFKRIVGCNPTTYRSQVGAWQQSSRRGPRNSDYAPTRSRVDSGRSSSAATACSSPALPSSAGFLPMSSRSKIERQGNRVSTHLARGRATMVATKNGKGMSWQDSRTHTRPFKSRAQRKETLDKEQQKVDWRSESSSVNCASHRTRRPAKAP